MIRQVNNGRIDKWVVGYIDIMIDVKDRMIG